MIKRLLLATFISGLSFATFAESTPVSKGVDGRIQSIQYNPNDVVKIYAKAGIATHIVLNSDETYQTHAFGDSDAWLFTKSGNHIFIKPKVVNGSTNLVVVTDRRVYNFYIQYSNKDTFQVQFTYPEQIAEKARQKDAENLLASFKTRFEGKRINLAYKMKGSSVVAPTNIWDDGTFTYFKFGNNTDLPAIYALDSKGDESLYNRTVFGNKNDIIMVHGISPKWRLRIGAYALDINNDALNSVGNDMESGTVSEQIEREVKE